jgi:hypothetical protein
MAGRSGGWVTLCAVYTVYVETRSASFLVEPQNQGQRFVSGLASKPLRQFSLVWPQNWWWQFLLIWPQNWWWVFWLSLKIKVVEGFLISPSKSAATVWWFGPQNHRGGFLVWASKPSRLCLSVASQNQREGDGVGHMSRSSGLLHVEVSRASISQSGLKTGGGVTAGGACGTIVEVALSPYWRWMGRCNGLHRTLLP